MYWPLRAYTLILSCSSCETLRNPSFFLFFASNPPQSSTGTVFSPGVSGGRTRVLGTGLVLGAHVWTGYLALWSLYPPAMGVNATTLSYYACIAGLSAGNPHIWATWPHRVPQGLNLEKKNERQKKRFPLFVPRPWSCHNGWFLCHMLPDSAAPAATASRAGEVTLLSAWRCVWEMKSGLEAPFGLCSSLWMAHMKPVHNASLRLWNKGVLPQSRAKPRLITSCSLTDIFHNLTRECRFVSACSSVTFTGPGHYSTLHVRN